jgi:flavodoxin
MSNVLLCNIVISSELSLDEIKSLETSLSLNSINLQDSRHRVLGVDDIVFVATVVSAVSATAQLIDYSIKAAKAINKWRRELRAKGREPKGKLEHPNLPNIDLSTATEEEIEAWFKALEAWLSQKKL